MPINPWENLFDDTSETEDVSWEGLFDEPTPEPEPVLEREPTDTIYDRFKSSVGNVVSAWDTGKSHAALGQLRYKQLLGDMTPETQTTIDELKAGIPKKKKADTGLLEQAFVAAAEMAPIMLGGMEVGTKRGLKLGMGAGAITAAAGAAIPLPEEALTVPAAFAGMFGVGMLSGTVENIGMIEAGLAYDELLDLKDDKGNKLDPTIAKSAAAGVGIVNGLIELAQINMLMKTIPGGQKLLSGIVRDVTKKAIKSKTLKNLALRFVGRYGVFIAAETAQEIAQESTNIIATEVATQLNNNLIGSDIPSATREEIVGRLLETAKQSALAFTVMGMPGAAITTVSEAVRKPEPAELTEDELAEVEWIKAFEEAPVKAPVKAKKPTPKAKVTKVAPEAEGVAPKKPVTKKPKEVTVEPIPKAREKAPAKPTKVKGVEKVAVKKVKDKAPEKPVVKPKLEPLTNPIKPSSKHVWNPWCMFRMNRGKMFYTEVPQRQEKEVLPMQQKNP